MPILPVVGVQVTAVQVFAVSKGFFPQVQLRTAPACLDGYGALGGMWALRWLLGCIKPGTPGKVRRLDLL